jgi:5-methylthioadenosine/S-adenosylhomocysteine deaminase
MSTIAAKHVDSLLTNAVVVTMNDDGDIFNPGAVAITGGTIVAAGPAPDLAARYQAGETVDCAGRVVMPGLVNAHTHAPMTLLRGLADDLRLDVWLLGYMMPVEREFVSPDFCRLGTLLACAEMIRSGVTTFADMYYFEEDVARAVTEAGMRALCGQTVLKFPSPDAGSYEESLAAARDFIGRWKGHELIVPAVAPHAPYTSTPEMLKACAELAAESGTPLHIHISETAFEVEQSRREHDMPVIPWVKKQGLFDAKVLAAHCVHIDDGEIHTLQHYGAGVAHNPSSNLKLGSGVAPVVQMLATGLNVGIGTDGAASNNDLDMFEETRLAAFVAKGFGRDPTALPARQALRMATILGARALHMGDVTGSLEPGKRADIAVVDIATAHNSPAFRRDPDAIYAQIVYAGKAADVTDVMVNGRWLMRRRSLTTLRADDLVLATRDYARKIDAFLIAREKSVLSKLVAIGGLEQEESFEVQVKTHLGDAGLVLDTMARPPFTILRSARYHQYDTYFLFDDPAQGRLRYREDEFVNDKGEPFNVRDRLTLTGAPHEREFGHSVVLSRSRFIAPAQHSLRFYREYFHPERELAVEKDRRRWHVLYKGTDFAVNVDRLLQPQRDGYFLEIKARTWSRRDAEEKAGLIGEMLDLFGIGHDAVIGKEYVQLAED